jgi:2-phosphosulfolactate phosphatase
MAAPRRPPPRSYPAGSYVLSGELNADTLPGFVHPTPKALLAEGIAGRRLIYCTTNGTVALAKSQGAAHVYAAALLNGRAVVERIVADHAEATILIVCSGSADNFNLEDFYGAGYLVSLFHVAVSPDADCSDAALAAELLHDHCDGLDALRRARVGRMMLARRLDDEVAFAAQESCYDDSAKTSRRRPASRLKDDRDDPTKTYKYYWEDFPVGKVREFGNLRRHRRGDHRLRHRSSIRSPSTFRKRPARPASSAGCAPAAGIPAPWPCA